MEINVEPVMVVENAVDVELVFKVENEVVESDTLLEDNEEENDKLTSSVVDEMPTIVVAEGAAVDTAATLLLTVVSARVESGAKEARAFVVGAAESAVAAVVKIPSVL